MPRRRTFDVLVIGAGITGALVSYELSKSGLRVAIVDRRRAASGSTPASTALLQYEIDTPLVKLSKQLGWAHAAAAYLASLHALQETRTICRELGSDVDLIARSSLQLAVKPQDVRALRREVKARRRIGIEACLLTRGELRERFGLTRPGAILSDDAFEVNPLKLTFGLLKAAKQRGAAILPQSDLDLGSLIERARPFRFVTSGGTEFAAHKVVIATGYETPEQFPKIAALTQLRSTYAIATTAIHGHVWPGKALLWEAGDPYFYARMTSGGRILVGGGDEPFRTAEARDRLIDAKAREIHSWIQSLLPGAECRTAFRWAGTFAQTKDGLPYIGIHRNWSDVFFALGYGGNGITFSVLAAKIIAAAARGRAHRFGNLFQFDR